jgi:ribosomal protein L32
VVTDAKTGSVRLNHRVDMTTGMYKGRKVIDVVAKVAKKQAKAKK